MPQDPLCVSARDGAPRPSSSRPSVFRLRPGALIGVALALASPLAAEDVQLRYDSRGNLVAIGMAATASLQVQRFTPAFGRPGDSVTVIGAGFSTTPASNAVTIGGAAATVTAESPRLP